MTQLLSSGTGVLLLLFIVLLGSAFIAFAFVLPGALKLIKNPEKYLNAPQSPKKVNPYQGYSDSENTDAAYYTKKLEGKL